VAEVARACALHAVQIHGDERAEDFARMPVPVWRAVRIEPGGNGPAPPPEQWPAAVRYVVDAAGAGKYGGSGRVADWAAAAGLARSHPVMLAGGLRAGNVARAIRAVRPLGVDVSSGVESRPGKKDLGQLEAFVRNARGIR
jgi:phosphoribosylanthranilate isomerase